MSRPRKLNDEQIAAAAVMWLARIERKVIARRFGVGRQTLYDAMARLKRPETQSVHRNDSPTSEITPLVGSTAA